MKKVDRRSFLKVTGVSLGIGTLYTIAPALGEARGINEFLARQNGEAIKPFSFVQLSDSHVGFNGPPDPLGTKAFERAVDMINASPRPDVVLFTGDLTHDSEDKDEHARRMARFREIAGQIRTDKLYVVPGEHDAGLDGGQLFREHFGETHYSFDHKGIHFIALDNVSRAKPEVGPEQIAWLKRDLSRFPKSAPIVVFTHRPLFDLKPEWEWFTSDGDDVMNMLAEFDNVSVLYGHIHRDDEHTEQHVHHYAARSLIFAFPDPAIAPDKKPNAFDPKSPFRNLGIRAIQARRPKHPGEATLDVKDVELTLREYSGVNGIQQLIKNPFA